MKTKIFSLTLKKMATPENVVLRNKFLQDVQAAIGPFFRWGGAAPSIVYGNVAFEGHRDITTRDPYSYIREIDFLPLESSLVDFLREYDNGSLRKSFALKSKMGNALLRTHKEIIEMLQNGQLEKYLNAGYILSWIDTWEIMRKNGINMLRRKTRYEGDIESFITIMRYISRSEKEDFKQYIARRDKLYDKLLQTYPTVLARMILTYY